MRKLRIPLGVRLSILIIVMNLTLSLILLGVSSQIYLRSVLNPFRETQTKAAEEVQKDTEKYAALMKALLENIQTEEFRRAKKEAVSADDYSILSTWMKSIPVKDVYPQGEYYDIITDFYSLFLIFMLDTVGVSSKFELSGCTLVGRADDGRLLTLFDQITGWLETEEQILSTCGDLADAEDEADNGYEDTETVYGKLMKTENGYLLSTGVPIVTKDFTGRIWLIRDINAIIKSQQAFVGRCMLFVILLTLAGVALALFALHRIVIFPLTAMAEGTRRFAEVKGTYGYDDVMQQVSRSNDEIGDLCSDIRSMQRNIVENTGNLTRLTAEKERILMELDMAANIQESMLPNTFPAFPDRSEFDLYASMVPAKEVGGDFYDFFLVDDDHLCLVIADVSDKGVPAALFMMAAKIIIANTARLVKSPAEILQTANSVISANNREQMFVTVWIGILTISTGLLTAANAGHEYPAVCRDGSFSLLKDRHGFVLGGMEGMKYQDYELQLSPGDKLFVYTDGVQDASNEYAERFETERMVKTLNEYAKASPREILRGMTETVSRFVGNTRQFDDMTMLCLEYRGK